MVSRIFIQRIYEFLKELFLVMFFMEVEFLIAIKIYKKAFIVTLFFNYLKVASINPN